MLVADQNFNSVLRASVHNTQALFRDLHRATAPCRIGVGVESLSDQIRVM
jgi:hypothetical protein